MSLVAMAIRPAHVHVEISAHPRSPKAVTLSHAQVTSVLKDVSNSNLFLCNLMLMLNLYLFIFFQMIGTVWLMSFHLRWRMVQNPLALVNALSLYLNTFIRHIQHTGQAQSHLK